MKKAILIDRILEISMHNGQHTMMKADIGRVLEYAGEAIAEDLAKGGSTRLPGLGTVSRTFRKARTGRNPQTGQAIQIPAQYTAAFKPCKELKSTLNPQED